MECSHQACCVFLQSFSFATLVNCRVTFQAQGKKMSRNSESEIKTASRTTKQEVGHKNGNFKMSTFQAFSVVTLLLESAQQHKGNISPVRR